MVTVSATRTSGSANKQRSLDTIDREIANINRRINWCQRELKALNELMSAAKHNDAMKIPGKTGKNMKSLQARIKYRLDNLQKRREELQREKVTRKQNSYTT